MRQPFHYLCVFYFILATQCQSMDSGATIATDPSFALTTPSTEQMITIDPVTESNLVTATPEPMMYASKIDPATESNLETATPEPMMYANKIDPVTESNLITATPEPMMYATTAMDSSSAVPTAMMIRRGTPPLGMLKRTATVKPKTVTATKNTKGKPKGILVGTNLATSSPATRLKTVSTTAAKRMATPQAKSIKLGIKNN
jgi:hypothetical protein